MKTQETEFEPTLDIALKENAELSEEIKVKHIENTPFSIITQGADHYGVIGTHRITEKFENEEDCEKSVKEITWDRITQVIWAIVEKYKELNKLEN